VGSGSTGDGGGGGGDAAAAADVPWIEKKPKGKPPAVGAGRRLGMCGAAGAGAGAGRSLVGSAVLRAAGSSRPSPADALAAELQAADACDMF
jgi:hypothetical protein